VPHIRKARDWRGTRYQISLCSVEELVAMLNTAINTRNQVNKFINEVQAQMLGLRKPPDPPDVA
jgi:hypothetical protein